MNAAVALTTTSAHIPLPLSIRAPLHRDRGYPLGSWSEAYKHSPRMRGLPWAAFKRVVVPELGACLERADTRILAAYLADCICGWIAYSPGRRVSTVHWVHTRYRAPDDSVTSQLVANLEPRETLRRRGVMRELLAAADLGDRIVYTHRGPLPQHRAVGEKRRSSDEWICKWLAGRGVSAVFVPMKEWSK